MARGASEMSTKYYTVRVDGKSWTKDAVTADYYTARGCEVLPARRLGDLDVWMSGRKVAVLFASQKEAAAYAMFKLVNAAACAA
jgi:hypothetical protein